ncbi:MAG TPA: hypothetical protein VMU94_05445 [Streptosporangiaceae bacterium]|nr:hypothetical protein [Streptosporangiaceae bacterium]
MENDRADRPERVRLPGFDERTEHSRPAYTFRGNEYGPPGGHWPPYYHSDSGVLRSRRASTWTAAALIAGVAATTGYLAHAIPVTGGTGGTTTGKGTARPAGKATVVKPSTPAVTAPVATSGGSGAGGAGGGGDN